MSSLRYGISTVALQKRAASNLRVLGSQSLASISSLQCGLNRRRMSTSAGSLGRDNGSGETWKSVEELKKAVMSAVVPDYCYGTVALDRSAGSLFFKQGSQSRFIDFANPKPPSEDRLLGLVETSQPATFGRNQEDVYDEEYRKAWALDPAHFASQFEDVVRSKVLRKVQDQLLRYDKSGASLEAKLYKLNVYGPGSFFKPHVDTPRSKDLFASLVVVLPTVHTGGNLLLGKRQDRPHEAAFDFDSSKLVLNAETGAPQIAFAAFYSDVEHEILPVETGYRITLTYDLQLSPSSISQIASDSGVQPPTESHPFTTVVKALSDLISTPKCASLRGGDGALGFGLLHKYPLDAVEMKSNLAEFTGALKGNDALIKRACEHLGMEVSIKVLYRWEDPWGIEEEKYSWVTDKLVSDHNLGDYEDHIKERFVGVGKEVVDVSGEKGVDGAKAVDHSMAKSKGEEDSEAARENGKEKLPVLWVTPPRKTTQAELAYITYGNSASMEYIYGELVLIATFPEVNADFD